MHGRLRVWFAGVLAVAVALCAGASASAAVDPWLDHAPDDAAIVVIFDRLVDGDATDAREALAKALTAPGRLEQTRHAWAELAKAMGLEESELTASFFGGRTMLVVQRLEPEPVWALLSEGKDGLPRRMIRSLKAAPRDIRNGVPVLSLERGRYMLGVRRDKKLGRGWLLMSPRGSEALFDRMLPALRTPSVETEDRITARIRVGSVVTGNNSVILLHASPEDGSWRGRLVMRSASQDDAERAGHAVGIPPARGVPDARLGVLRPIDSPSLPEDGLVMIRGGRTPATEFLFRSFAGVAMPETPQDAPVSVLVADNGKTGTRVMLGVGGVHDAERYDAQLAGNGAPDYKGLFPGAIRRASSDGRCLAWSFSPETAGAKGVRATEMLLLRVGHRPAGAADDLALARTAMGEGASASGEMLLLVRPSKLRGLATETSAPAGVAWLGADTLPLLGAADLVRLELRKAENGALEGSFLVKFGGDSREP